MRNYSMCCQTRQQTRHRILWSSMFHAQLEWFFYEFLFILNLYCVSAGLRLSEFWLDTGNRQCRAHGLQNARISCGEVNVRSRAYPLNTSDLWRFWRTFLEFCCGAYVFRYQRLLRDLHCCCLDPAVPLGTPVVSSWLGACLFLRPWVYLPAGKLCGCSRDRCSPFWAGSG